MKTILLFVFLSLLACSTIQANIPPDTRPHLMRSIQLVKTAPEPGCVADLGCFIYQAFAAAYYASCASILCPPFGCTDSDRQAKDRCYQQADGYQRLADAVCYQADNTTMNNELTAGEPRRGLSTLRQMHGR